MKRILYIFTGPYVFWGSVGIFVRVLTDFGMDNYTVLGSRMAVASVILFFLSFSFMTGSFCAFGCVIWGFSLEQGFAAWWDSITAITKPSIS